MAEKEHLETLTNSILKLSIITINLNNREGLEKTIRSVKEQTFTGYEYLVVDGGSTDGSIDVIINQLDSISRWIAEPDRGIYNAMNKGIGMAGGEYCLFLNSGDWLDAKDTLTRVFEKNISADIISGNMAYFDSGKQAVEYIIESPEILTAKTLFTGSLPHQATFIRRQLFNEYGLYNEEMKIAADWQFFLKVLLEHQVSYEHVDVLVSYFNMEGISCNPETYLLLREEQQTYLQKHYARFIDDYVKLKNIEDRRNHWESSKEYVVYKFLKKIGIIYLGVLYIRTLNFIKRKLIH